MSGAGGHRRGPVTLVVILDGTLSSLAPGTETNAGLTWKLLTEGGARPDRFVFYEAGVQWDGWKSTRDVITGRGLNRKIERAYGFLASRYRPGDRIFLFGYSRGAFAVRSLAGAIDSIGLPRSPCATERVVRQAYRHYRCTSDSEAAEEFTRRYCHTDVVIEMVGVWDTVKALGLRMPLLWRLTEPRHAFHNHALGQHIRHGYHALALDETRMAYEPILWESDGHDGHVEQRWFEGSHGDIGGQVARRPEARGRANLPLQWILGRAEAHGLDLPSGWRMRFPADADAPSVGTLRGWGKLFLFRRRRQVGRDPSEVLDASVGPRAAARGMGAEQPAGEVSA
ncbi:MAG: DUF2235 domain-containing protein [Pseudomonadota bacterium]